MFSARQGFFAPQSAGGFGNSAFWATQSVSRWLRCNSSTELITWRASSGYTLEYWLYPTADGFSINPGPGNKDASGTNYWSFGPRNGRALELYFWSPGQTFIVSPNNVITLNAWNAIAMVVTTSGSTSTVSFYVNGSRVHQATTTTGTVSTGTGFNIGAYNNSWVGYMDNLRVSNIARYSGTSYTLATEPFTSDANTQLLLTCDGPAGSTTFTDSSSFARAITNNSNLVVISADRANHT